VPVALRGVGITVVLISWLWHCVVWASRCCSSRGCGTAWCGHHGGAHLVAVALRGVGITVVLMVIERQMNWRHIVSFH